MLWSLIDNLLTVALVPVVSCCINNFSFLVNMITMDSINTGLNYVVKKIATDVIKIKENDDINKEVYKASFLDRYIIYFTGFVFYRTTCYLFWIDEIPLLYYLLLFIALPIVMNNLRSNDFIRMLLRQKKYIIKILIAKQASSGIKYFVKIYLHRDVKIKIKDIMPLLNNYDKTIENTKEFIKSVIISIIFIGVKRYSSNYYGISKYIYSYKTGETMTSFSGDIENAKKFINDIIDNKEWELFTKQCTQNAMYEIYMANNNDINIIKEINEKLVSLFIKMSSIYNIAVFCNFPYLSPILELIFMIRNFYDSKHQNDVYYKKLLMISLSVLYAYFTQNVFHTCVIAHLFEYILFNKLTYNITKTAIKKTKYLIIHINQRSKHLIMPLIINVAYIKLCSSYYPLNHILWYNSLVYNSLINFNKANLAIFLITYTLSYLSNYNIYHMVYVAGMIYVMNSTNLLILIKENNLSIYVKNKIKRYFSDYDKKYIHYKNIEEFKNCEDKKRKRVLKTNKIIIIDDYYKSREN